jgi:metal-dependent amidase/aminoacylase/carboxypeptidase family protein
VTRACRPWCGRRRKACPGRAAWWIAWIRAGSEDATFFINAVQARGGAATYLLVGTPLAAGHHQASFDFDEAALSHAVALHAAIADRLLRLS